MPRQLLLVVLGLAHYPLNWAWRAFCFPLGRLFTHRGVLHWPVIGTLIKVIYLYGVYRLGLLAWQAAAPSLLPYFATAGRTSALAGSITAIWSHIPYLPQALAPAPLALAALMGAVSADLCHIAVDFAAAVGRGKRFMPPPMIAPRGLLWQVARRLRTALR